MVAVEIQPPVTWVDRYEALLAQSGLDRRAVLQASMPPVSANTGALFSLADCLRHPGWLIDQIRNDYPDASSPRQIRARVSVLHQDLALNIIAPLTLRLFRDEQAPLPDPERIAMHTLPTGSATSPAPSRWSLVEEGAAVGEQPYQQTLSQLANDWYPVFRQQLGVSPGAYWSSMGLGLGAPFSAVWNQAEPEAVAWLAQSWLTTFDNGASQFIDWICAEFSGQTCAIPQRRGCCLKYLLPNGGYCGTCGVYRKQRMAPIH